MANLFVLSCSTDMSNNSVTKIAVVVKLTINIAKGKYLLPITKKNRPKPSNTTPRM